MCSIFILVACDAPSLIRRKHVVHRCADTLTSADEITFEDVGNWYNTGGFEVIPWLELLDLRKW